MSDAQVTVEGLEGVRPGREAIVGVNIGPGGRQQRRGRRRGGEEPMVPNADFRSYYGKPIINQPTWEAPDIPGYLFLGGLAGAGSVMAAGAQMTGRPGLARANKVGSAVAAALSLVALVHDLGQPRRFLNMLRTFKPTSPMSVGSWLLSAFAPAALAAAASDVTGKAPRLGALGTAAAAAAGPALATYTAALVADTAVPAWHDGHQEMPFVFAASACSAAAGVGLLGAPVNESGPALRTGVVSAALELGLTEAMKRRMGLSGEAYEEGKAHRYDRAAQVVTLGGIGLAVAGRRRRLGRAVGGVCLVAGSALTRFAIFEAGLNSSLDPKYTVIPQRRRRDQRQEGERRSSA
jgi:formate-dependent nitrite reductase membrane component NrfD